MRHTILLIFLTALFLFRLGFMLNHDHRLQPVSVGSGEGVLNTIRQKIYLELQSYYPSPHVELLVGTVIGYNGLRNTPTFNDILIKSGTIHVVVVSGFNIVLLFSFVEGLIGSVFKFRNYFFALIATFLYAVFTGFGYPVIRAWIMSALSFSAKYLGLSVSQLHIVIFSALVMLIISPEAMFELSFQLSFLAVSGLVLVNPILTNMLTKLFSCRNMILNDFISSLSAQSTVWPLLSYSFGTINVISPFVNACVLWTIPRITILGMVAVSFLPVRFVSQAITFALYPFLDIFVELVTVLSRPDIFVVSYKLGMSGLVVYYLILSLVVFVYNRKYS